MISIARATIALALAMPPRPEEGDPAVSRTADLVAQARLVLAREDSGKALALLDEAIRRATDLNDEAFARTARVEVLSVLALDRDAAGDVERLERLLESGRLDPALGRRAALRIASWIRASEDHSGAPPIGTESRSSREVRAIAIALELSRSDLDRADALEHRSLVHTVAGDFERARADLEEASALYRNEGSEAGSARCLRRHAFTAYRAGEPARALDWLDRHRPLIPRDANDRPDLTESRTHEFLRTLVALELGDLAAAERAAHAFVRCSAALLDGLPWGHVLRTHRSSSPAVASLIGGLMRYLAQHPTDEDKVFEIATILAETAKARLLRVALGHPIPREGDIATARRTIPPGVGVLRFLDAADDFTGRRSLVLFAARSGERRIATLGESGPLGASLEAFWDPNGSRRGESAREFAARSEAIARALFAVALPWIVDPGADRVERLVVLADGLLARVPLEALVVSRTADESDFSRLDYLVRHASVIHLPSFAVFDAIRTPSPDDRVVAVLKPAIGNAREDLRFAARERLALEEHYRRVRVLEGPAATKTALFEALAREPAGWLHLACHAEADPAFRFTARLRLAPDRPDLDPETGALHALEIFAMPLTPGARVVLSACSTASGDHVEGEGVLGVWRAFLAAGASAVVSTVGDVDDRAAAAWMTSFHREAARGIPLAEASRRASLAWLDGSGRPRFPRGTNLTDPAHPSMWANYLCVGDDGGPLPSRAPR